MISRLRSFVLEEKKEKGRCEICDSRIEKEEYGLMIEIDVNIGVNIDVGIDIEVEGDSYLNIDK